MKAIMLSIKPQYCELIANGKKTVEVRKTRPKIQTPFKCYIYCTIGGGDLYSVNGKVQKINEIKIDLTKDTVIEQMNGKVIGEFVCDKIGTIKHVTNLGYLFSRFDLKVDKHCLSYKELDNYFKGDKGYALHISDLKIYDKPKELSEFYKDGILNYDDWLYAIYNGKGGARSSYESYRNVFKLKRPPQSWCYVEELK